MALAKRLYLTFKDWKDQSWTAEIWDEGFGGTASEMVMSGNPVNIRWGGDKWKPIIGSECTIEILSSGDLTWLNTTNGRDVKVIIKKGAVVWWEGYALPNQYYDSLNYPRYFSLNASDGLGALRDYLYIDSDGDPYDGYDSAIDCLAQALAKTGLELKLRSTVDLFEDANTAPVADNLDPLKQTDVWRDFVQSDVLYPGNTYDLVSEILKVFQARLYQSSGFWHVNRVPSYSGTVDYRDFTFDTTEYDYNSNGSFDPKKATGSSFKLLRGGMIETNEPYKQLTVISNYGLRDTIIKGSTFPELEFDGANLKHWTNTGSGWAKYNSDGEFGIYMDSLDGGFDDSKYIVSDSVPVQLATTRMKFTINMGSLKVDGNNNWRPYVFIRLVVDDGAGTYYWWDDINNGWQTESSLADCEYVNYTSGTLGIKPPGIDSLKDTEDVVFYFDGFRAGNLSVYIHDAQNNPAIFNETVVIKGFTITVADTNVSGSFPPSLEEITIIDTSNKILAEYNLRLVDMPSGVDLNEFPVYKGVLRENIGDTSTYGWFEKGTPGTVKTLSGWLATFSDADIPYYTFRGQIYGSADFFNTIELTEYGSGIYFWTDVNFNVKKVLWDGEAIQMQGLMLNPTGSSTSPTSNTISDATGGGQVTVTTPPLKTFKDTEFSVYNETDSTKVGTFDLSGLTSVTTRVLTWPDKDGTIATLSDITGGIGGTVSASYVPYGASADTLANSAIRANASITSIGASVHTGRKLYISQQDNTGDGSGNAYGLYIAVGGYPSNNNYGIYISVDDGANDGFAIYTNAGKVYFDDLTTLNGSVILNSVPDYGAPASGSRILTLNEATDAIEYIDYSDFGGGSGVTSVSAGNGLDFTTITTTGSVTLGTPSTLTSATSNAVTSTSHTHAITCGIANTNIVKIDHASVADNDYAKFTSNGLEGRSYAEVASDIGAMTNPMTTQGDIIIGGASGTPERLGAGSNGQMLYHDGTDPYWDDAPTGSGDISGSGTAGYIPYFSATKTIGNSNIRFSSDNVGINQEASSDTALAITSSDTYALAINSGDVIIKDDLSLYFGDTPANDGCIYWDSSQGFLSVGNTGNTLIDFDDSEGRLLVSGSKEKMSWDSGGVNITGILDVSSNIELDGYIKIKEQASSPGQASSGYINLFVNNAGALCYTRDDSTDVYICQVNIPV